MNTDALPAAVRCSIERMQDYGVYLIGKADNTATVRMIKVICAVSGVIKLRFFPLGITRKFSCALSKKNLIVTNGAKQWVNQALDD